MISLALFGAGVEPSGVASGYMSDPMDDLPWRAPSGLQGYFTSLGVRPHSHNGSEVFVSLWKARLVYLGVYASWSPRRIREELDRVESTGGELSEEMRGLIAGLALLEPEPDGRAIP